MEHRFEIEFLRTPQRIKQMANYLCFRKTDRMICIIIMLISFIASIVSLIIFGSFEPLYYPILGFFVFIVLIQYFSFRRLTLKRDLEMNNGEYHRSKLIIDENGITTVDGLNERLYHFSSIKKAKRYRNYVILISKSKLLFFLPADAFTKGAPEDLIVFLKDKGIKAK